VIVVVLLSVASSLFYGTSDFLGGLAARRLAVLPATLVNYLFGTAVIGIALAFGGWSWSVEATISGSAAALFAAVGFITFYAAMAIGPMSLLSPVVALIQALVPVTAALVTGQGLSPLGWGAVALAVVATILISQQHVDAAVRVTLPGAVLAVTSGVLLGASVVALDASPADSGLLPAFLEMAGGVVVLAALIGVLRLVRREIPWFAAQPEPEPVAGGRQPHLSRRGAWLAAVAAGVLLGGANAFLMSALHLGNLAVVSVLSSLYPLATVLLAAIVLRERVSRIQIVGIALAIVAAVLLSVS
jgi:drug/metabolite transporter (DMT)-like permease